MFVFWPVARCSLTAEMRFHVPTSLSLSSANDREAAPRASNANVAATIVIRGVMISPKLIEKVRMGRAQRLFQGSSSIRLHDDGMNVWKWHIAEARRDPGLPILGRRR